jgi:hypothetical protein
MKNKENSRHLYLDLMKRCLVNMIYIQLEEVPLPATEAGLRGRLARVLLRLPSSPQPWPSLRDAQDKPLTLSTANRIEGRIWPLVAHTMIGLKRLDNLEFGIILLVLCGPGGLPYVVAFAAWLTILTIPSAPPTIEARTNTTTMRLINDFKALS